jgi:hypothetical protein
MYLNILILPKNYTIFPYLNRQDYRINILTWFIKAIYRKKYQAIYISKSTQLNYFHASKTSI